MKTCGTCSLFGPKCEFIKNLDKELRSFAYSFVACAEYTEKKSDSDTYFKFDDVDDELEDTV